MSKSDLGPPLKAGSERSRRGSIWLVVLTLMLLAGWHLAIRPGDTGYQADSVFYLAGAQSLAEEGRYVLTTHVGSPRIGFYPPLQSLYLAVTWSFAPEFSENVPWLQGSMILLLLALGGGLFALLRAHDVSPLLSALLTLTWGISPYFVYLIYLFLSDPLFVALGLWVGVLWARDRTNAGLFRAMLTGVGLALMFLTRTAAVGFLLPLGVWMVVQVVRGKIPAQLLVWTLPTLAAILLWSAAPKETPSYSSLFRNEAARPEYPALVAKQAAEYASGIHTLNALTPRFEQFLAATMPDFVARGSMFLIAIGSMALVVRGFLRDPRPWKWPLALALAGYQAQLVVWPWQIGTRSQLPVMAFFLVWFLIGLSHLPARLGRIVRLVFLIFLLVNLGLNGATSFVEARALAREGDLEDLREMAEWTRDHVPDTSRIAAGNNNLPLFHFVQWSGRRIAFLDFRLSLAERVSDADYILVWKYGLSDSQLRKQSAGAWRICHESPNGQYQLVQISRTL